MSKDIKIIIIDKDSDSKIDSNLKNMGCSNIKHISKIQKALNEIRAIKFKKITIIINGKIFSEFAKAFKEEINSFYLVPKIFIYTENEESFRQNNKKMIEDKFYQFCELQTSLDKINDYIKTDSISKKFEIESEPQYTFEYIDNEYNKLALHLYYKVLIDYIDINNNNLNIFTNKLYEKYKNNHDIKELLGPIKDLKNIPIILLSKYYARAYTLASDFYREMNSNLRENKTINNELNYLYFIKLLYKSILNQSFPLNKNKKLFRGTLIYNYEIKKLREYFENKKDDTGLSEAIIFSRAFLSFTKSENKAKEFINSSSNYDKSSSSKVLFILEKDSDYNINYKLATHADIENLSYFPDEKEVLFFPFSSFVIKDIIPKILDIDGIDYEIYLRYLCKKDELKLEDYLIKKEEEIKKKEEELKNEEKEKDNENKAKENDNNNIIIETEDIKVLKMEKIDNFEFKEQLNISGLIKLDDIPTFAELFLKFKEYKKKIREINSKSHLNIIKGKIYIPKEFVNKNVKIIGAFKGLKKNHTLFDDTKNKNNQVNNFMSTFYSHSSDKKSNVISDYLNYINEKEIRENVKIKIDGKEIPFSFYHKFDKKGEHNIEYIFTKYLTKIDYLFNNCKFLTSLDLSNFDTSEVINMCGLFNDCTSLKEINLTDIETEKVFDMSYMFNNCKSLKKLNLSYFDTKNVYYMDNMFHKCIQFEKLNLSNFFTNKVVSMNNMFSGCKSLSCLNLSNFNVDKVVYMLNIFYGCDKLKFKNINNKSLKLLNELKKN